jgi:hypothetical protein
MKLFRSVVILAALATLGGCVVAPPAPGYAYYPSGPGYYYAPAPYYYGPSVSFGFSSGRRHRHWR